LMGTSGRASGPRWPSLRGDVLPMITLFPSQGDFCVTADNGSESNGVRTQFLHRMVQFADHIAKPIQLLYYPPYHSKYNPIERCWGILELHWNGTKLIDVETMLEWAKSMTWKGMQPVVELSHQVYQKGISLGKRAMHEIEKRLERHPQLPKWEILIRPASAL